MPNRFSSGRDTASEWGSQFAAAAAGSQHVSTRRNTPTVLSSDVCILLCMGLAPSSC